MRACVCACGCVCMVGGPEADRAAMIYPSGCSYTLQSLYLCNLSLIWHTLLTEKCSVSTNPFTIFFFFFLLPPRSARQSSLARAINKFDRPSRRPPVLTQEEFAEWTLLRSYFTCYCGTVCHLLSSITGLCSVISGKLSENNAGLPTSGIQLGGLSFHFRSTRNC